MTNSPKTAVRFPAGSRKQQIVETVLDLVAVHGIEAVSFQLVADQIGVTQPAVIRHFPTKEALWLAVMDWLEQRLAGIYSSVDTADDAALVVLSGMFLAHIQLIGRYPALAKLVFSDHLRLQFPILQARFGSIHKAYMARLSTVLGRAGSEGSISETVNPKGAATMFLSLVQGLGFQIAIAGLLVRFQPEAERVLALYLQGLMREQAVAERVKGIVEAAKRELKKSGLGVRARAAQGISGSVPGQARGGD